MADFKEIKYQPRQDWNQTSTGVGHQYRPGFYFPSSHFHVNTESFFLIHLFFFLFFVFFLVLSLSCLEHFFFHGAVTLSLGNVARDQIPHV